jgi:tRNA A37 threonylcarbamoyladenosine dehydratase
MSLTRLEALVGPENIAMLRRRTVLVCGLGGVGGHACEALARSGVGRLVIADDDIVSETDLNRQTIALRSTVGMRKTEAMKARIADIDPDIDVLVFDRRIEESNLDLLLAPRPDHVVDAIDDVVAKTALLERCLKTGIPIVSAMGFANRLHPACVRTGMLAETSMDPLAKAVRTRLRRLGIDAPVPVVWSDEPPLVSRTDGVRLGSSAFVPATAGLFLAAHVVNALLGGDPS